MRATAALIVLSIAICATTAEAGPLLTEDFESYTQGSWPSTWSADANAVSDPTRNMIAADPTDPTNNTLMLHGLVGGSWGALAYRSFAFPEAFTLEFDVYNGDGGFPGVHQHRANIGMRNGTYWYGGTNPNRYLVQFMSSGEAVSPGAGAYPGSPVAIANYVNDQWYHYQIDYVRTGDTLTLRYRIDGVDAGSVLHTGIDLTKEVAFDHLEFTVGQGTAYLDNIVISELNAVPLPGALPLGAVGFLLVALFRRRRR